MSGDHSLSAEAATIRQAMIPEVVDPLSTVEFDRQAWIDAVADAQLTVGIEERVEYVAGVPCRWVSPIGGDGLPTIVYAHGGGLIAGSSVTHRQLASQLASAADAHVLLVDYRLLPEHGIEAPIEDVLAVHRSLVLRFETERRCIVFAGDSSGAALVVAAVVALRDAGDPLPAGVISFSGAFDATLSSPSIDEGRDPQISRAVLEHWQDRIRPVVDLDDPRVSPLFAALDDLPPVLLLAGGDEAWRDDSVRLSERLIAIGVEVELDISGGMWHVWPLSGTFPESDAALRRAAAFVRACCS